MASLPGPTSSAGISLGIYVKPGPGGEPAALNGVLTSIGRRLAVIQTFTTWETAAGEPVPFPTEFADYVEATGAAPMITWQPESAPKAAAAPGGVLSDQPAFSLASLASGTYDAYVTAWASKAKAFGHTVYVRLMHEMNTGAYPWGDGVNGNTGPQQYVAAWQHIVGIFRQVGADNVQFVWCAAGGPRAADPTPFYPGDQYVSWVAIDGYNRAKPWKTITQVFSPVYAEVTALTTLPLMIAETGTVQDPANPTAKAQWIVQGFEDLIPQTMPRVRAVLYFDAPGHGYSYPLSSTSAGLQAFSQVAASPGYQAVMNG